jgi:hypothetical protein
MENDIYCTCPHDRYIRHSSLPSSTPSSSKIGIVTTGPLALPPALAEVEMQAL